MDSQYYDGLQPFPEIDPVTGELRYPANNTYMAQQKEASGPQYPQQYTYQQNLGGYVPQNYQNAGGMPDVQYQGQNTSGYFGYGSNMPGGQIYQNQPQGYPLGQTYVPAQQPYMPSAPVQQTMNYQMPSYAQTAADAARLNAAEEENNRLKAQLEELKKFREKAEKELEEQRKKSEADLAAAREEAEKKQQEALAQMRMQFSAQENERQQKLAEARAAMEQQWQQTQTERQKIEEERRLLEEAKTQVNGIQQTFSAEQDRISNERHQLDMDKAASEQYRQQLESERSSLELARQQAERDRAAADMSKQQIDQQLYAMMQSRKQLEQDKAIFDQNIQKFNADRAALEQTAQQLSMDRNSIEQFRKQLEDERAASEALRQKLAEDRQNLDRSAQELLSNRSALEQTAEQLNQDKAAFQESVVQLNQDRAAFEESVQRFHLDRNELEKQRAETDQDRAKLAEERAAAERFRQQLDEDRNALEAERQQSLSELAARERLLEETEKQSRAQRASVDESRMREAEGLRAFFEAQRAEAERLKQSLDLQKAEIEEQRRQLLDEQEALEKRLMAAAQFPAAEEETSVQEEPEEQQEEAVSPFSTLFGDGGQQTESAEEPAADFTVTDDTDNSADEGGEAPAFTPHDDEDRDVNVPAFVFSFPSEEQDDYTEVPQAVTVDTAVTDNEDRYVEVPEEPAQETEGITEPETEQPEETPAEEPSEPAAEWTAPETEQAEEVPAEEPSESAAEWTAPEAEQPEAVPVQEPEEPAEVWTAQETEQPEEAPAQVPEEPAGEYSEPLTTWQIPAEEQPETSETPYGTSEEPALQDAEPEETDSVRIYDPDADLQTSAEDIVPAETPAEGEAVKAAVPEAEDDGFGIIGDLEDFEMIDPSLELLSEGTDEDRQSFSDLLNQFSSQLDLGDLPGGLDDLGSFDAGGFTIIDNGELETGNAEPETGFEVQEEGKSVTEPVSEDTGTETEAGASAAYVTEEEPAAVTDIEKTEPEAVTFVTDNEGTEKAEQNGTETESAPAVPEDTEGYDEEPQTTEENSETLNGNAQEVPDDYETEKAPEETETDNGFASFSVPAGQSERDSFPTPEVEDFNPVLAGVQERMAAEQTRASAETAVAEADTAVSPQGDAAQEEPLFIPWFDPDDSKEQPEDVPAEAQTETGTEQEDVRPDEAQASAEISSQEEAEAARELLTELAQEAEPAAADGGQKQGDLFDFDAAVDGLATAVLRDNAWLYSVNNLISGGEELLSVQGLTSKYYVNEVDCSYPSYRDISFGFPTGSCTAVISSVPFCAYAFVRAIACPEEVAEGVVMLGDRKLTHTDVLYIGSDRLVDKKMQTIDWLMSTVGGKTEQKRARFMTLLEQFGMTNLAEMDIDSLSYSQRMLVLLIAVSFSSTPVILINDPQFEIEEVDVNAACGVFKLLSDSGKTVLLSGRLPRLMRSVANRVLAIHYGNNVFCGTYRSFIDDNCTALVVFHSDEAEALEAKLSKDERFEVVRDRDIIELRRAEGSTAGEREAIEAAKDAGVPVEDLRNGDKGFSIAYQEVFKARPRI